MCTKGIYAPITGLVTKKMKFKNYDKPYQSRLFSFYSAQYVCTIVTRKIGESYKCPQPFDDRSNSTYSMLIIQ